MWLLYLSVRIFPFWAIPFAILLIDFGRYQRRKEKPLQFVFFGVAGMFGILSLLWLFFGGYTNYRLWVDAFF